MKSKVEGMVVRHIVRDCRKLSLRMCPPKYIIFVLDFSTQKTIHAISLWYTFHALLDVLGPLLYVSRKNLYTKLNLTGFIRTVCDFVLKGREKNVGSTAEKSIIHRRRTFWEVSCCCIYKYKIFYAINNYT